MRKDYVFIGTAVVVLLVVLGFSFFAQLIFPSPEVDLPKIVSVDRSIFTGLEQGSLPGADVEMIMFEDYACPFCRQMHPDLNRLRTLYKDQVNFVYKHFPVKGTNVPAQAAECARDQGRFWEYNDILYTDLTTDRSLLRHKASQLGLDSAAFDECLSSGIKQAVIDQHLFEALQAGVKGTPTFFINGNMIQGVQSISTFRTLLDQAVLGG